MATRYTHQNDDISHTIVSESSEKDRPSYFSSSIVQNRWVLTFGDTGTRLPSAIIIYRHAPVSRLVLTFFVKRKTPLHQATFQVFRQQKI